MKKITNTSNFKELIESNSYYVDKTYMIEELLESKRYVTIFLRPSKYGKSLFISMLDIFFNIEYKDINKNLFKNLKISKSKYYHELSSKPVIVLDLKTLTQDNYDDMMNEFRNLIMKLYDSKKYILDKMDNYDKKWFSEYLNCNNDHYSTSLLRLCEWLYDYYSKHVIILVDGYDESLENASKFGFLDRLLSFMDHMLDMTMKDNKYLEFGIVTGILRPSEPGIFGGFNNYLLYSLEDDRFNDFFGFTKEKVLNDFNLDLTKEVEDMYNNYNYNPWSIINYCKNKELKPYIALSDFIIENIKKCTNYSIEYIENLKKHEEVYFRYDEFTSYKNIDRNILNILFFNGFLKIINKENEYFGKETFVKLVNNEVKEYLERIDING